MESHLPGLRLSIPDDGDGGSDFESETGSTDFLTQFDFISHNEKLAARLGPSSYLYQADYRSFVFQVNTVNPDPTSDQSPVFELRGIYIHWRGSQFIGAVSNPAQIRSCAYRVPSGKMTHAPPSVCHVHLCLGHLRHGGD